ncbi:hypothetical protein [Mesorhizobium sp. WSM2239]|jgi:hypothetical protein|uniref:Intersectin-EH binding protein Ibp1 n=2 Tax=unclassified Mesorhizobium TaxID=325217 RepID=A0AAU8D3L1_9HYPH
MKRFLTAAGLMLASTVAATAQTSAPGCGDIGITPTPQLDEACNGVDSLTTSTIPDAGSPGLQPGNSIGGTTSTLPGAPEGMPPLIVPNDPLGTGNRDASGGLSSSGDLSPGRRSGAIQSPSVD